ncbi:MAG: cobalt-precorrin-5B (C(1))-methyltransferase CbiD [Cyanobacteriota bacterium]|nr:cobalt-precorrin-5B (C(1))-methyltransferase CbiD [Cyanobacteriota bacterium]
MPAASRGYTLPVWVAAAARASVAVLRGEVSRPAWPLHLLQGNAAAPAADRAPDPDPDRAPDPVPVPVGAAAPLGEGWALAEAVCDPGDGLDLTRGLTVWALTRWEERSGEGEDDWLRLEAGAGVGVHADSGAICASAYARALLAANLRPLVPTGLRLRLRLVLPRGRQLAERTSNAAFGVVEGLALIGTRAEAQASADPVQLDRTLDALATRLAAPDFDGDLILVIGENGLDLAPRLGLPADRLLKVGNWLGPVLVAAGQGGVRRLLLFGYQGKLIKLAGGIFHTHHHLADGRAEVLTALAALEGLQGEALQGLHDAPTVEAALANLEARDPPLAARLRQRLAATIERRTASYLERHAASGPRVGAALFDRGRRLCAAGPLGEELLAAFRGASRGDA